jgi:hypothetical protein
MSTEKITNEKAREMYQKDALELQKELSSDSVENVDPEMLEKVKGLNLEGFINLQTKTLKDLLENTKAEIKQKVQNEIYTAMAETGLTIKDVGQRIREEYRTGPWKSLLKGTPDHVLDQTNYDVARSALLSCVQPVKDYLKDDESRAEGLKMLTFIEFALRVTGVHYNGCKQDWDRQDNLLKQAKANLH